jgi:hypothetical protein
MLGMPDIFVPRTPQEQDAHWDGHNYRWLNQGIYWAWALTHLAMGTAAAWGHDALFDVCARTWNVVNGLGDPWRARQGYGPIGGETSQAGWKVHWNYTWQYNMFGAHYRTYYRFPWE